MVEAEPGEVRAEAALRRGHPEVGRKREPAAAADGRALHGGHDGERRGEEAQGGPVQRGDVLAGVVGEVEPRAEVLALRRQDDGAAPPRAGQRPRRPSATALNERGVEVVVRRAAQGDHADVLVVPLGP